MTSEAVPDVVEEQAHVPSWLRWPPNCCETCQHWARKSDYLGNCASPSSTNILSETDSRFRCQDFVRVPDA